MTKPVSASTNPAIADNRDASVWRSASRSLLARSLCGVGLTAICAGGGVASAAFAQVPIAQIAAPVSDDAQEVVVTGSHIKTNDVSSTPLSIITAKDIQSTNAVSLDQVLTRMPDLDNNGGGVSNNQNPNGSNSSATVSLRNLGYGRTLVLLDGQRLVPTPWGGQNASVDISTIPAALIERVDVLKDGASSIYGADAIGGVINIITRKTLDGIVYDGSIGLAGHGDNFTFSNQLTMGAKSDRGSIVVTAGMLHENPIRQTSRSWAADQFVGTDAAGSGPNSSRLPGFTTTLPGVGQAYFYGPAGQYAVVTPPGGVPQDALKAAGVTAPPGVFFLPGSGYKFSTAQNDYLVSRSKAENLALNGGYELTSSVTAFVSGLYTHKVGTAVLNPEPEGTAITTSAFPGFYIPANLESYTINPVNGAVTRTVIGGPNPGNPYGVTLTGNARIQTPNRVFENTFATYRLNAGLEGKLGQYDWQLGYVYGQSDGIISIQNSINTRHLSQLTGQAPCGSDVGCSIGNFLGLNTLTAQQIAYLTFDDRETSSYKQQFAYGSVSGSLFDLPAGQVQAAVGFELRKESLRDDPSFADINFESATERQPTRGGYDVQSVYAELTAPIFQDSPIGKSLKLNMSVRYDNYSEFGGHATWKVGADYVVSPWLRFRAETSTAFRAPPVSALFGGRAYNNPNGDDPCSSDSGQYRGTAGCVAALTAAGVNPATFVSSLSGNVYSVSGGNADLKPETAHYYGGGAVITPLNGVAATIDYYKIDLKHAITTLSAQEVLNDCYGPTQTNCGYFTRGSTGDIGTIFTPTVNAGSEKTSGLEGTLRLDLTQLGLQLPFVERLRANGALTYLLKDTLVTSDGVSVKKAGTFSFGIGEALPRVKASFDLDAELGHRLELTWHTRYIGGIKNRDDPTKALGNQAGDVFYHDVSVAVPVGPARLIVGVNNVFNRTPPFLADASTNSLPAVGYDYVGRFFFAKVSIPIG